MRIKQILSQSRRDFTAIMECEFCGETDKNASGYEVIPNMKCKGCGHSTISKGGEIKPQQTKYPEGFVI